jgi:hypothetical protein
MIQQSSVRIGHSLKVCPAEAVKEFYARVAQSDMAFVIFFCSNTYDRILLASEMAAAFDGVQVIGQYHCR